jgi:hypothetical protein
MAIKAYNFKKGRLLRMPRPAILPVIDWKQVFESGLSWDAWLEQAESADQALRMRDRLDALAAPEELQECLASWDRPVHVIAIAEDWCGDVVRHAPVLERICQMQPLVQSRYISRAAYPDVFARFLTNGGEAIPKFIFLNEDFVECGNWGPMQEDCRQLIARGKACGNVAAAREIVSEIYQLDPSCKTVFLELCGLLELAAARTVEQNHG